MKTPSEDLWKLIRSLTTAEKGYFIKFAKRHAEKRENNYLRLFDAINKQEDKYDEALIVKTFKNEKFVRQLTSAKNYLYNMILRSLVSYNENKSTDSQIAGMRDQFVILFQKTLFDQSEQILKRAKKKARDEEKFSKLADLMRDQKNLDYMKIEDPDFDKYVDDCLNEELDVIERQKNVAEYYALYLKISSLFKRKGVARNKNEAEQFRKIIQHPLMKSSECALSVRAKNLFYIINYIYHYCTNDLKEAFQNSMQRLALIEKNPEKVAGGLKEHIFALNDAIAMSYNLKNYKKCIELLRKQRELTSSDKQDGALPSFAEMYVKSYSFELNIYIVTGYFSEGAKLIEDVTAWLERYKGKINKPEELKVIYSMAVMYFGAEDYSRSLNCINKILNDKSDARLDYKAFARILNMVIHYQLGNYDLLNYEYKSAKRFLSKSDKLYKFEDLILKFVTKLPDMTDKKEREEYIGIFAKQIEQLIKNEGTEKALEYFDVLAWTDCLLSGRSFADAVRRKSNIRLSDLKVA